VRAFTGSGGLHTFFGVTRQVTSGANRLDTLRVALDDADALPAAGALCRAGQFASFVQADENPTAVLLSSGDPMFFAAEHAILSAVGEV
jgi:hypothetical protein